MASPSPAAPNFAAVEGVVADIEMSFDITNYNYYDLEKDTPDATTKKEDDADSFFQMAAGDDNFGETVAQTVAKVFKKVITQGLEKAGKAAPIVGSSMPAAILAGAPSPAGLGTSLTEVGAAGLVAAGPAPAPPAAAAEVVAPSGAVDPSADQVNVFVAFRPGSRHQPAKEVFLQTSDAARSTTVDVVITDKPMTGANILPQVREILMQSQEDGLLKRRVKAALFQATGISPTLKGLSKPPVVAQLKQWEEGSCETHMEKLVKLMEVAYTRRMVPQALYNECTNLIPSMTFSHDPVATRLDRNKCRTATIKFAQRWNYGKASWNYGAGKGHEPMDFSAFCRDVCEVRFGGEAPQCNVNQQIQKGA